MAAARAGMPLFAAWLGDWRFLTICGVLALLAAVALLPLMRKQPQVVYEAVSFSSTH
jgi:hypothetical protein